MQHRCKLMKRLFYYL